MHNKKFQKIIVIILAVVMLLSVLLPAITVLSGATSSTKNKIDSIKNEISSNSSKLKELEKKLKQAQTEQKDASAQKTLLQQRIGILNEQISSTEAVILEYDQLILEKEEEIAELEEKEAGQYELFCRQVRDMEEQGSVSYLSILFSASSFTDLLDKAMLISEVMEYHNGVIDTLVATREDKQTVKTDLETALAEEEELKAAQEANKADLLSQEAELDALIAQIKATQADYEDEIDKFEQAAKDLDKELKAAEEKYKKELEELNAISGEWYWPLPGRYYISSTFANRINPISKKYEHHSGNDIPAPGGTPIHVAQAGIVTDVKVNNSVYGNCVLVSHGNGYSTFYAHMKSAPPVKVGQKVEKGEVIGYVGSTGWSTGNHLHFEVRINGVRGDSLKLYPNLKFTYAY